MKPCEYCKKLTKRATIIVDCGACRGDGVIEEENDYTSGYHLENCYNCDGKGEYEVIDWYCSEECYMSDMEDFLNEQFYEPSLEERVSRLEANMPNKK